MIEFANLIMTTQFISSYSQFTEWVPIAIIAMLASLSILSLYYAIGAIINNAGIKKRAVSEIGQVIGAAIIMVLIIAILPFFGSLFAAIIPVSNVTAICNQLSNSQVTLLNSGSSNQYATAQICGLITQGKGITATMDYGLAATYVITANMTNQFLTNLNSMYIFMNYMGFLSSFTANTQIALGLDSPFLQGGNLNIEYSPLAGYAMIISAMGPMQTQAVFMFESFLAQPTPA